MKNETTGAPPGGGMGGAAGPGAGFRPLRIWPALALAALMLATRFGPMLPEGGMSRYWMIAMLGPLLCCALLLIWWVAASRASWRERLAGVAGLAGAFGLTVLLADPTMRGPGMTVFALPLGLLLFAVGAAWLGRRRPAVRTGGAVLLALAGFGVATLLRNEGMTGGYEMTMRWRWSPTAEEAWLALRDPAAGAEARGPVLDADSQALANPEWPGFRGAGLEARAPGPRISTNWAAEPPRQVWKIQIGPGWSSFAAAGRMLFTQEQRGPMEMITCYDAHTGREIWSRGVEARIEDPMGGPGPRATPALAGGRLFAMGATGILLRLDPLSGEIVWQKDLKTEAGRAVPMWGFSASPLAAGSLVIVYAGGPGDLGLLAFDAASGEKRWSVAAGSDSYSSPQLSTVAGENLVLMLTNEGLSLADPQTGRERLNYAWKFNNYRALQPRVIEGGTILLPTGMNAGTRAIRVTPAGGALAAEELWTSRHLKPDFTDLVVWEGHIYGNDAGILTCVDLKTGERRWKGGRYGKGQILLLEQSGLLLVAAESGQVVLVSAHPGDHHEVGSFKALEGKTWNHPVLVGDRLYVRNSQEAAAYQLKLAGPLPAETGR